MNIRTVLRTYGLLRQLADDETALLETLRSLTDSDREQLVESLAPVNVAKKAAITKTYERCAQCGNTKRHSFHNDSGNDGYHEFQTAVAPARKSSRAASLATAISGTAKPATPVVDGPICTACGHPADYEDHAQPSPHYHPFAPHVRSARGQSSRNGAEESSIVSSAIASEGVSNAARAAGEGASGE